jgi:hypothetical protein
MMARPGVYIWPLTMLKLPFAGACELPEALQIVNRREDTISPIKLRWRIIEAMDHV